MFICAKLFSTEYPNQLGSIEGSFIAISRYTIDHFGDLKWWPLWFCGMPYRDVYGPVLHNLVALVAVALKISPALAFHKTVALFYCLGPVTLFWMVYRFSGSLARGFWSGLLYSLLSPAAIVIPAIRNDVGGMWHLRRLYNLVVYGESPHIASLALMPLVLIALDAAIRRGKLVYYPVSAVALAVLVLTNITGSVGFGIVLAAYLFAMPSDLWTRSALQIAAIGLLAYGLAAPWIPPSSVQLILANSQHSAGGYYPFTARHVLYAVLILAGAALLYGAFTRFHVRPFTRFALFLTYFAGAIALPAFWWKIAIIPQPERFQLEFEMGCCLALAACGVPVSSGPWKKLTLSILAVLSLAAIVNAGHFARGLIQPVDVRNTIEYKEARWFDANMSGKRVFAPGSVSFWMNVFTDTPQVAGCCDQGMPDFQRWIALYTIYRSENAGSRDAEISLLWLQAYGAHAVGISNVGAREWYKPFVNPTKFDGVLPVLWRDGGDVIYRVPQRSDSLAHVIRPMQVITRAPRHGLDIDPLRPYVAAINDPTLPLAPMRWRASSSAEIATQLRAGDLVSVQVTYNPGWHAFVNGAERRVESDALGMLIVHPDCTGPCTIDLSYDGGREVRAARTIAVAVACLFLLLGPIWARIRTTYR